MSIVDDSSSSSLLLLLCSKTESTTTIGFVVVVADRASIVPRLLFFSISFPQWHLVGHVGPCPFVLERSIRPTWYLMMLLHDSWHDARNVHRSNRYLI